MNLNGFKLYVNNYDKIYFKQSFRLNGYAIELISDEKCIIEYSSERLLPHFRYSNARNISNKKNIFAINFKLFKNLLYNSLEYLIDMPWTEIKHMGGIYFNTVINSEYSLTLLTSINHKEHGSESLNVQKLIKSFIDKNSHIFLLIDDFADNFYFIYNNLDQQTQLGPMRLIRSLMMRPIVKNDYFYFHAAAINYKDKGILLCGNSGKGKTSTLLKCLTTKKCSIIANDKVFIGKDNGNISVIGWPTVVTLGVGTLRQYKQLNKYLTNIDEISCNQDLYKYLPQKEYLDMSIDQLRTLSKEGNKLAISHKKLSDLFNKKIMGMSNLNAIININLDWNSTQINFRKLDYNEKISLLNKNIIENISDQLCWLGYSLVNNNIPNNLLFDELINSVNFYELKANFLDDDLINFLEEIE